MWSWMIPTLTSAGGSNEGTAVDSWYEDVRAVAEGYS
jgi:hypothetical protein